MKQYPGVRKILIGLAIITGAIVTLMAANWQTTAVVFAILTSERRPALLKDAQWNEPATAARFRDRFHTGTPESELLAWLAKNRFAVDTSKREAHRLVAGLPCNENIHVTWSRDLDGRLIQATAVVVDPVCL